MLIDTLKNIWSIKKRVRQQLEEIDIKEECELKKYKEPFILLNVLLVHLC